MVIHERQQQHGKVQMDIKGLQKAICPLIDALHQASMKTHVREARLAMEEGKFLHSSKRLQGAVDLLDHAGGKERLVPHMDAVVQNWKPVQELIREGGWTKTAERIIDLPGMDVSQATFQDIATHLVHLAAIATLMASEQRLSPVRA